MKEINLNNEQAQDISEAIIALAAEDYRKALKEHITSGRVLKESETFFGSKWAQFLASGLDMKCVFERLEQETALETEQSEDYLELVKAFKSQKTKNTASRIRVFSDNGVFYILNLTEGNKKQARKKALQLLKDVLKEK